MVPLMKLTLPKEKGGARTEMQRKLALKLVLHIIKRTTKCTDSAILEKTLSKYDKIFEVVKQALELKTEWKKPVKCWLQYLTIFLSLSSALKKNGALTDLHRLNEVKGVIEAIISQDKQAAGLKGKLKEIEQVLKS